MQSRSLAPRPPRRSLWLASVTAAGLLPCGGASLCAQTAATWNGGAGNWSNAGFWTPGTVPNAASADVRLDGGKTGTASTVNVDGGYTVGRLTVDAGNTLSVNNSQALTNNGTVTLESFNRFRTGLVLTGDATLAGTGTLTLSDPARVRGTGTLTNAAGHTVRGETSGSGSIGAGQINIVNQGLILNDTGARLNIDPATFSNTAPGGNTSGGVVRAGGGSTVVFTGGNGSIIHAAGSLTLQGTGVAFTGSTALLLSLGAPAGPGSVGANNDHVFAAGAFTLDGTLSVTARAGFGPGVYDLLVAAAVPEPSTWALPGLGIAGRGVVVLRRRQHRRAGDHQQESPGTHQAERGGRRSGRSFSQNKCPFRSAVCT